jgi:hypothetical protein
MVTVKIPEKIRGVQVFNKMQELIQAGCNSFEFNVRYFEQKQLIISTDVELVETQSPVLLKDLFHYMCNEQKKINVVLNLQGPNLEVPTKACVEEWALKNRVKYTGKINPKNFTPWDKLDVYYNVENCIPNFYQLKAIKKTHFDVLHYFCRKYKLKNLRIHEVAMSADILCWAKASGLNLSVCGTESFKDAEELAAKGVSQVTTVDITNIYLNTIYKEK